MGRPVRMFADTGIYFVTARTVQSRLLLRPSAEMNDVIGGVLARATRLFPVRLFGFVFASNHFHLIVQAEGASLSFFMQYFMSNVAKKVGRLVEWEGGIWGRRYSAEPILDDDALIGRLTYILAHGVKEALVNHCRDWPGLSCLQQLVGDSVRKFRWFNWTRRWNARAGGKPPEGTPLDDAWAEAEELKLHPLPCWQDMSSLQRRERVLEIVASIEGTVPGGDARSVLGPDGVRAQSAHAKPTRTKRSSRPLCHAATRGLWRAYRDTYRAFVSVYRRASRRWRAGDRSVTFPAFSIPPVMSMSMRPG